MTGRLRRAGVPTRAVGRRTPIAFDWDDPATWERAIEGARAAYVAYSPDIATPGASAIIASLVDGLRDAGVEHVTLLSGRGEPAARRSELILENSGLSWAIARCAWFAQNFSEGFLHPAVMTGVLALPAGSVAEPFLDVDDIADVAAATLLDDDQVGRVHELTGPELLTFDDVARVLSRHTETPVVFADVTREDFVSTARANGLPQEVVEALDHLFEEILDGRNASVTDGVERALGRPAGRFADVVDAAARAGAWAVSPGTAPIGQEAGLQEAESSR